MPSDPTRAARWAIALTGFWLLTDIGQMLANLWQIWVLGGVDGIGGDPQTALNAVDIAIVAQGLGVLAGIPCLIVGLRWVYVINRNAHRWSDAMTIRPGWNVGWFFIPFAALFKPFEGIRESRSVTIDPDHPESVPVPSWMRIWLGLWLASQIYGNVTGQIGWTAETPQQLITMAWLNAAGVIIDIPLAIMFRHLVINISTLQRARILSEPSVPQPATP